MIPTLEALKNWNQENGFYSLKLDHGYEICLEPLLFDGQWYLAIYKDQNLVTDKICIKSGYVPTVENNPEEL